MLKEKINNILRTIDYQLIKVPFSDRKIKSGFYNWIRKMNIKTVLDVGSNEGQFIEYFIKILPDSNYYCFEPLSKTFEVLHNKFNTNKKVKLFNFGLGDKELTTFIHHNDFSPSSSILEMNDLHKEAFPLTRNTTKEEVKIKRLDDLLTDLRIEQNILLKIDVQGYEMNVLQGSEKSLSKIEMIIVETSFNELYKNQPLFEEIYNFLVKRKFLFRGVLDQVYDQRDGKILQADAIFIKCQ